MNYVLLPLIATAYRWQKDRLERFFAVWGGRNRFVVGLFLLIVEAPLWKPVICDLFVNSQKDGCLWAVFVAYLLRGFFQKRRFGLKNYNSITSFSPMLRNRRSRCLPSVGHLFQDHSRTIMTFCLQNCLQCYEMAFFIGYQVEGCFSSVKVQKSSICSLTSE